MSVLIIFIKLIAVFDLLVIAVYFGGDILSTMLNKLRRKPKQDDPFDFSLDTVTVAELQKGFFCQNDSCKFAIWKNNKWWTAKKKQPTKAVVSALLNDGCVRVTGLYSEKTGKTYDATVVLEDDGQYANFKLEFDQRKGGSR